MTATPSGRASSPTSSPTPTPPDLAALAEAEARRLSDTELVGQVLMPSITMSDPAADSVALVRKYHLGGVILMGNVTDTESEAASDQVRRLTEALRKVDPHLLIGVDQEYGWVTRIKSGVVQLPSAMAFGAAGRPDLTEAAWRGAGAELASIGINVNFAPSADVIGSPANTVIGSRSFGSDPDDVARQVAAAVRGLQSAGVAATLKHFPGHGHTTVDSHEDLPVLKQSRSALAAHDLPPFRSGIDAGAMLVMSGHLNVRAIDADLPASFSRKALVDLLRDELGFTGVVVTDALNMAPARRWSPGEAAVRAILAGNDLLLMPPDLDAARTGLLEALGSGRLPRERLLEAVTRVLTLKYTLEQSKPPSVDAAASHAAARAVAAAAITVLRGPCSGPLVTGPVRVTASGGRGQQAAWLAEALKAHGVPVVSSGGSVVHLVGYGDRATDLAAGAAVTVAMDSPYLLASATSPVRVATYSSTQVAMEALAAVVAGRQSAPGRSPVDVAGLPRSACSS